MQAESTDTTNPPIAPALSAGAPLCVDVVGLGEEPDPEPDPDPDPEAGAPVVVALPDVALAPAAAATPLVDTAIRVRDSVLAKTIL